MKWPFKQNKQEFITGAKYTTDCENYTRANKQNKETIYLSQLLDKPPERG